LIYSYLQEYERLPIFQSHTTSRKDGFSTNDTDEFVPKGNPLAIIQGSFHRNRQVSSLTSWS